MGLVGAIQFLSPRAYGLSKRLERGLGVLPANARVCDADTILEAGLTLGRDLLSAYSGDS